MKNKNKLGFSALLRGAVQASGLAQWEVARKVGIHASEMSRYVAGRKIPTWPRALALLQATGAEVSVYLPGEQDSGPSELARFRQWAEENHAGGYSDMVWEEWEKYHSGRQKMKDINPNTYTDPRDGQAYRTVELNGRLWLAQNLNYDVGEGCWFYENDPKNGEKYGRLYTWEAAKKACPPGWRLPADEEWRNMARQFSGADDGAYDWGKAAYKALIHGGSSGFSALLGGWRFTDGSFYNLGDDGNYWSATEYSSGHAWYYSFNRFLGKLYRSSTNKGFGFSCRCVQDI